MVLLGVDGVSGVSCNDQDQTSLYACAKDDEAQPQARPRSRTAILPLLSTPPLHHWHSALISERLSNHARVGSVSDVYVSWQQMAAAYRLLSTRHNLLLS